MEARGAPLNDPGVRFALDNILDGLKDDSALVWQALDTDSGRIEWIMGRKTKIENGTVTVLPCAILVGRPDLLVKRYAPAVSPGHFDYSKIPGRAIITPDQFQSGDGRR